MSTNRSKDRSSLCSFTFVDGRHCRTLECGGLVYPEPRRAAAFEAKAPAIPTSARSTPGCSGGSSDPPARGRERPFRQLCVRVRSQFRPRTPLLRCRRCSGGSSDPPARGRERPFRQLCVRVRSQFRPRTPLLPCRRCSGGSSDPPARWPRAPVSSRGQRGICFSPLYIGQTLVQILPLAQHEYIEAYDTDAWRDTIRESHEQSANHTSPDPDTGDDPSPTPEQEPAPAPTSAAPSDASPASK